MTVRFERMHLPQNKNLPRRRRPPKWIIYHNTGSGMPAKAAKVADPRRDPVAFDRAARDWYEKTGFKFYPNILIGVSGMAMELAPLNITTWHVPTLPSQYAERNWPEFADPLNGGGKGWVRHGRDPKQVYDWWFERWPGIKSPLDLISRSVNANTVAVDFIPMPDGSGFTEAQMKTGAMVAQMLSDKYGIPKDRKHHLGHEDIHPVRRGTIKQRGGRIIGQPWDPGKKFDWDDFIRRMGGRPARPPVTPLLIGTVALAGTLWWKHRKGGLSLGSLMKELKG